MKTQYNYILSVVQMRDNGCVVNDVAKAHEGTQMMMTPNGVRLPFIIKNGLMYLEHYYPTQWQIDNITAEEWMINKATWDPSKLDDIKGASDLSISQFPSIPAGVIASFYNSQGDIRATKSDLTKDPVVNDSPKDPVVSDSSKDPVVSDSTMDHNVSDSLNEPVVSDSKKKPSGYRPKPKKKKKQKKGRWKNNKKIKSSVNTKPPTSPTHLLPIKHDPRIVGIPAAVKREFQAYLEQAHVETTSSNGDDNDDDNNTTVQVEDVFDASNSSESPPAKPSASLSESFDFDVNNDYGELVNNEFLPPFDQQIGPTGATIIHDGVLFAKYSNCHRELYYDSSEIYGDDPNESEETINRIANSSEVWTLCDNAPSLEDDSMFHFEFLYEQHVTERNQRLAYQDILDNCADVGITEAELHEAQAPLNPTIRQPEPIDYSRMIKYFGHVPADII